MTKRTFIYVDGFNLYYRSLKNTPYKWLDLKELFSLLLSSVNSIDCIKYFTTMVSGKLDPNKPTRQETYIRALESYIPEIKVYYGHFLSNETSGFLANVDPPQRVKVSTKKNGVEKIMYASAFPDQLVKVVKTEEKGSDVNIAVHLVNDAWQDKYDCAIVVSNDSDLAESLRIVKEERGKVVGLITPVQHPSKELIAYSSFVRKIRSGVLSISQLPNPIPGTNLYKPVKW